MDFGIGLFIGMLVMFILWHYESYTYKKILVMKAICEAIEKGGIRAKR